MNSNTSNTEREEHGAGLTLYIGPAIILVIGIIISIGIFSLVRSWEQSETLSDLKLSARSLLTSLQTDILRHQEVISSIAGLFSTSENISRKEFRSFVKNALVIYPAIQGLSWNPLIKDSERALYTAKARKEGFSNFDITELDANGQVIKAPIRENYITVYYIEPYAGNETAMGLNIASHPDRIKAILQARDTGLAVITERIKLVQEKENKYGYLLFKAIYQNGKDIDTQAKRRKYFTGLAVGVFRFSDWIPFTIKNNPPLGIDIWISDLPASGEKQLLYLHSSRKRKETLQPTNENWYKAESALHWQITTNVLGRQWSYLFSPSPAFIDEHKTWQPWISFLAGLFITLLLTLYLFGRAHYAANLATTNRKLQDENDERLKTEIQLRDKEARVAAIVDTVIDGIITITTDGIIESFNPAAESIFGYDANDVIGKKVNILMAQPHRHKHDEYLNNYLQTGRVNIIGIGRELEAMRSDSSIFPIELSVSEMWIGGQRKFTGVVRDITERKKAEMALLESETQFRLILDNVPAMIARLDSDMHYQLFNKPYAEYIGLSINDYSDLHLRQVLGEKSYALASPYIDKVLSGQHVHYEICPPDNTGTPQWLSVSYVPDKNTSGKVIGFYALIININDRKLVEHELQKHKEHLEELVQQRTHELSESNILLGKAKEQAELASRSKSAFLANMSHELRTPLNVILGYAHILQNDSSIDSTQREKIKTIERSGEQLLEQISDLLDVAKIEANKIELILSAINIKNYLEYVCNYFTSQVGAKDIELICTVDESINQAMLIDERRLQQIFVNLIGNAIKFTEKGKMVVKAEACEPVTSISEKKYCLRFSVEDTGIGIAKENMEQIFQPFVQLKQKNHKAEGTGLGLNIAQQLVKLMGGELKVESEVNKGSRFWFDLILAVAEEASESPIQKRKLPTGYHGKKRKILAVDDMKDSREVIRDILTGLGFQVVVTSNGLDSVIIARDMQPDLILMDLMMPGLDGYESLTTLRNIPECKNIPVVAMSAGFDCFLPKPAAPDYLISKLAELLNLEWIFESDSLATKGFTLVPPPLSELEELKKLAELGKMNRIVEWADLLSSDAPEYREFALHIRALARDVKDEQIIILIGQHLDQI